MDSNNLKACECRVFKQILNFKEKLGIFTILKLRNASCNRRQLIKTEDCSCLLVKQNRNGILIFLAENVFTMLEMNTYWPILKIIWLLSWIVGACVSGAIFYRIMISSSSWWLLVNNSVTINDIIKHSCIISKGETYKDIVSTRLKTLEEFL